MAVSEFAEVMYLEYDLGLLPAEGAEVCSALAAPIKQTGKEAAGQAFNAFARRQSGLDGPSEQEDTEDTEIEQDESGTSTPLLDDQPPPGTEYRSKGKKKKKKSDQTDYYKLLGLQNERWTATEQQIKLAYRKQALECHPDKAGAAVADEPTKRAIESKFREIQEAYDVLSDPARRREYDSVDDFDDTLPVDCAPADFFKVFAPAFRRNSKWSISQPVPEVGDDSTPYAQADAFYTFWFTFRSWREFPHPDEEDVEQAESREERRWIERYNAKLRDAAKKEEKRRLKEFVEAAYARDPRILRQREEERAERERKKREKQEAARAKREAGERAAAEAAAATAAAEAAAAEEAAEARKLRQKEKKATQKERQRLRSLCSDLGTNPLTDDRVETLCSTLALEPLTQLADRLAAAPAHKRSSMLSEKLGLVEDDKQAEANAKWAAQAAAHQTAQKAAKQAEKQRQASLQDWDAEEVRMLEKAIAKYPQGTAKRWEQVAGYVRTRTVDEVLDMVKHGLKAAKFVNPQNGFQINKKRQGNTAIKSEMTQRHESFSDVAVPQEPGAASANGSAQPSSSAGSSAAAGPSVSAASAPDTPAANGSAAPAAAAAAANGHAASAQQDSGAEGWSEAQELALVQAMKKHGKELDDRWDRVAGDVPGKSKAQCLKRFKALRSTFRAKQGSSI